MTLQAWRDFLNLMVAADLPPMWRAAWILIMAFALSVVLGGAWALASWMLEGFFDLHREPFERAADHGKAACAPSAGRPSATYKDPDCWRDQVRSDVRARLRLMPGNGGAKR